MSINTPNNTNKFVQSIREEINTAVDIKELKSILTKAQAENLKGNIDDESKDEVDQLVLERATALDINIDEFLTQGQDIAELEELTDGFRPVVDDSSEVNPFDSGIELPEININALPNNKSDYNKCLNELEDFSGMLDHNQLLNIYNSSFENNEQKEELYALWIQDLIKTENEDRIESSLKEVILENPGFDQDLETIINLLPNLSPKDKEKMLNDIKGGTDFLGEHTTFFDVGNQESDDTPFYINTKNDEINEINEIEEDVNDENTVKEEVHIKENTPKRTQSSVRKSILAVAGLVAVIGLGVYGYNKTDKTVNTKNTARIHEKTSAEGALVDLDTGTNKENLIGAEEQVPDQLIGEIVDAEVTEETDAAEIVDAEVTEVAEETVDAEVAEVAEETVDAEVAEVAEETVDAEIVDAEVTEETEEEKLVKIPFLREESINMTFVPKTTIYGDKMINFDSSIIEWEKDGWKALQAFYHSPTKRGWILKNEDQVVFILQQIINKGEDSVLAYVQPTTW